MKTVKVLLVVFISAAAAAVAAACSSSSSSVGGVPSSSGSSGGGVPSSGTHGSSGTGHTPSITFGCGPMTCNSPLTVCCVTLGGGSASGDAATGATDGAHATDANAAEDSGEAGGSTDSATSGDTASSNDGSSEGAASTTNDAAAQTDTGASASEGGGGSSDAGHGGNTTSGDGGLSYTCNTSASACMDAPIVLGCASHNSCSGGQSCCGTPGDGGTFVAKCASPPCLSGISLCVETATDCLPGQVCVFPPSGMGVYGTCVMADAGPGDGGRPVDSGGGG